MRTLQSTADQTQRLDIHWKRVVLAGFLSEIIVTALLIAVAAFYVLVNGRADQFSEFGRLAGYYGAVPAAAVATFLMAFLAVRKLESSLIANGLLVGVVATLLTVGFAFGATPEDRWMYIMSFAARILAGCAAGFLALKMKGGSVHDHARQVR